MAEAQGSSRFRIAWRGVTQHVAPREAPPAPFAWRETLRSRLLVFAAAFVLWTGGIEARLFYLQVWKHTDMVAFAESQQNRTISTSAPRGAIYDRHGELLAVSVNADTISADPSQIQNPERVARLLCEALGECTGARRTQLTSMLRRTKANGKPVQYVRIARKVSPNVGNRVKALDEEGVIVMPESRRYYPNLTLGANFIGWVGDDNEGLAGIEAKFDSRIGGVGGVMQLWIDGKQRTMAVREEQPATIGDSIELTVDQTLQHIADRELRAGVREYNAKAGMAIVMDPNSGEILALSNYPTYNPNAPLGSRPFDRANRAVQHIYEPGSTFKLVTAAAAIEEQVLRPTDLINCAPGFIRIPGRSGVISDVHAYGTLSFEDVIVKSSNVGAIKAGQLIGAERMSIYVNRFGFGQVLSPDFGGQSRGIVYPASKLDLSGLASVSMGYQVSVTPMQMAAAVSSIANGGTLYEPHMVRAFISNGRREAVEPRIVRRTVRPETAAILTRMMEGVVERGTARAAQLDGYTVAGKTGTAAVAIPGGYSDTDYNVSFVGFVPSRKPALAVVVVIDAPHGKVTSYGGTVAAPIFKKIAEASLRHLGIAPNINPDPPVLVAKHSGDVTVPIDTRLPSMRPEVIQAAARMGVMPDLVGLSARDAVRSLTSIGLVAQLEGDGFVVAQSPEPGTALVPGGSADLTLKRRSPVLPAGGAHQ